MKVFERKELKKLWKPKNDSNGEDNGQVTIIGGSRLFHGAPILSLKVASRMVDMVFFATPEKSVGHIAESIKSKLMGFIWVPWEEVEAYIEKSDTVLIGPGFMRYKKEVGSEKLEVGEYDEEGERTRKITKRLLTRFPNKKWVIDAGSLQTMDAGWIPEKAILTPNRKEFETLFKLKVDSLELKTTTENSKLVEEMAKKYKCTIVLKGPETIVCSSEKCTVVKGGNAGLTKGGTGDVLAGLTVALRAKNDAFLAASAASYIVKASADELYKKVSTNFNADDLANQIPVVYKKSV